MNLYLDYDSVLNDMCHAWIDHLNEKHGTEHKLTDVDSWDWFRDLNVGAFDWFKDGLAFELIQPLPGAKEFLDTMVEQYQASILTASSPQMIKHKDKHIVKHFGDQNVHHYRKKSHFITGDDLNVLVDDSPHQCMNWAKRGGVAILFNYQGEYTYTQEAESHKRILEAWQYEEVYELLRMIKEGEIEW